MGYIVGTEHAFVARTTPSEFWKSPCKKSNLSAISMVTPRGFGCNQCGVAAAVTQSHSGSQMTRDPESKREGEPVWGGGALRHTAQMRSHTRGTRLKLFKLAGNPPICAMWHESFGWEGGHATASHSGHLIPCQCYPSHIHVIIPNNGCFQIKHLKGS